METDVIDLSWVGVGCGTVEIDSTSIPCLRGSNSALRLAFMKNNEALWLVQVFRRHAY